MKILKYDTASRRLIIEKKKGHHNSKYSTNTKNVNNILFSYYTLLQLIFNTSTVHKDTKSKIKLNTNPTKSCSTYESVDEILNNRHTCSKSTLLNFLNGTRICQLTPETKSLRRRIEWICVSIKNWVEEGILRCNRMRIGSPVIPVHTSTPGEQNKKSASWLCLVILLNILTPDTDHLICIAGLSR